MALIDIQVPDIGDFDEVAVIELLVKPGDTVKAEQSLITVESDKASMEIPSSTAGVVKELRVALGDKVKEGSVVLVLEAAGEAAAPAPAAAAPAPAGGPAAGPAAAGWSWSWTPLAGPLLQRPLLFPPLGRRPLPQRRPLWPHRLLRPLHRARWKCACPISATSRTSPSSRCSSSPAMPSRSSRA